MGRLHRVEWRGQRFENNCWFTCFQMATRYHLSDGPGPVSPSPSEFQQAFIAIGDQEILNPAYNRPADRNAHRTIAQQLGMRRHALASSHSAPDAFGRVQRRDMGLDARPIALMGLIDRAPVVFPCLVPRGNGRSFGHDIVIAGHDMSGGSIRFNILDPAANGPVAAGGWAISSTDLFRDFAPWFDEVYSY